MKYNWDELRARAGEFASAWQGKQYKKAQVKEFYHGFFDIFGVSVRRVLAFETPVQKLEGDQGFIDLFWNGVLLVEHSTKGGSPTKSKQQIQDYFPQIADSELPGFVLVTDFQSFELRNLDQGEKWKFTLDELPHYVEKFAFMPHLKESLPHMQKSTDIFATELVRNLHDDLKKNGFASPDLEKILVRILFCLFADDTGLFDFRDTFGELLNKSPSGVGEEVGRSLVQMIQHMNGIIENRMDIQRLGMKGETNLHGGLFTETVSIPTFEPKTFDCLQRVCSFDWSTISPAIFGSLFQFVLSEKCRREQGVHYTTDKNILKVLEPLFLTELWEEFEKLKAQNGTHRRKKLLEFHKKLAGMNILDPACGCGNFLAVAYREIRRLEIELIRELRTYRSDENQKELDARMFSLLDVNQFHGIEIDEFAVRVAETVLWMMDHIMNCQLRMEFGHSNINHPLVKFPNIIQGDALEMGWGRALPSSDCSHIIGNPPFIGSKNQSAEQRRQVQRIAEYGRAGGTLDYAAAWFIKSAEYAKSSEAAIGFVATNSIIQGEQVTQLWPLVLDKYGLEITFAHQTFAWESDIQGAAHVDVVIIGLVKPSATGRVKKLFSYQDSKGEPIQSKVSVISPHLYDASDLTDPYLMVKKALQPLNQLPRMVMGTKPIDDGNYIFSEEEKQKFLKLEPDAKNFFYPFVGSHEFLNGGRRWILLFQNVTEEKISKMPAVRERIERVRMFRKASASKPTQKLANFPTQFDLNVFPKVPFLVFPATSGARREYLPIDWMEPPIVPSDSVLIIEDADIFLFGMLTSLMHMSWLRRIGGRLTSSYRYSIGMVYNTFPIPDVTKSNRQKIESLAQSALDARKMNPDATLSQLYDPETMPNELRKAHAKLDREVDRLYRQEPFKSEAERVKFLLPEYKKMLSAYH